MFQPLQALFSRPPSSLSEEDIRLFVQMFLRRELKTDALVCQGIRKGVVTVRVGTPALQQEVLLLEYDLKKALREDTATEVETVKVIVG